MHLACRICDQIDIGKPYRPNKNRKVYNRQYFTVKPVKRYRLGQQLKQSLIGLANVQA